MTLSHFNTYMPLKTIEYNIRKKEKNEENCERKKQKTHNRQAKNSKRIFVNEDIQALIYINFMSNNLIWLTLRKPFRFVQQFLFVCVFATEIKKFRNVLWYDVDNARNAFLCVGLSAFISYTCMCIYNWESTTQSIAIQLFD